MPKLSLLALALAFTSCPSFASSYFLVVPHHRSPQAPAESTAPAPPPVLVSLYSLALPNGVVGEAYSADLNHALQVTGDPTFAGGGVTWSIASGSLPAGLTLSNGVISGTPTASENQPVTVAATYKNASGEQSYQLTTLSITVTLASATLPNGVVGVPYSTNLKSLLTVQGDPTYDGSGVSWRLTAGQLPEGLTLSEGVIEGTPTTNELQNITVEARYRNKSGQQTFQLVTISLTVTLASATLTAGHVGKPYSYDFKPLLSVTGDANYTAGQVTWTASGLPSGISLSNGAVSGTPASIEAASISVVASYKGKSSSQTYTLPVLQYYTSCKEYLAANPGSPSGSYTLDVDGTGPQPPQSYYCDMTAAGGGWTKIVQQYEATPVANWTGGTNGNSFTLSTSQIPAHSQVAFGKDNDATFIDYVNWTYTTGDIALKTLAGLKNPTYSYHVHRLASGFYNYHNPEDTWGGSLVYWVNTLTFDRVGGRYFTWAFAPNAAAGYGPYAPGYALNGVNTINTPISSAWTVWVR